MELKFIDINEQAMDNLDNYIETFNWLHNLAQTNNAEDLKVDATLLILTSHNNVNKEIKFKGVFPTSMTPIEFDAQAESIDYVQMDITFAYTNFEFV